MYSNQDRNLAYRYHFQQVSSPKEHEIAKITRENKNILYLQSKRPIRKLNQWMKPKREARKENIKYE